MIDPLTYDFFIFLLFEDGGGSHTIEKITYKVRPCQIHLLFPGQVHQWELAANTICHKLMINKLFFQKKISHYGFWITDFNYRPVTQLEHHYYQRLLSELLLVKTELTEINTFEDLVSLRCGIFALLIKHVAEIRFCNLDLLKNEPIIRQFLILVERHFRQQKSVAFYADQLNITPNYLSVLCKKKIRMTALDIIQERIILEAQRQINSFGLSIKEIGFDLGFSSLSHFSSFFKLQTGLSPKQYQDQCKRQFTAEMNLKHKYNT